MYCTPRALQLKNGDRLTLRSPGPADAQAMLSYLKRVAGETHFLVRRPEEVAYTPEEECNILEAYLNSPSHMMIAIFAGEAVVANLGISPIGPAAKLRHRCGIGLAILADYWGRGLGTLLIREAVSSARQMGYVQMELGVFSDNERAIRLYEKEGFAPCGAVPNAFRLKDGTFRDELQMVKTL